MKGIIRNIRNLGTIWQIVVTSRGKETVISGDWRPISYGIEDAFGSPENAIGKEIEYKPDPIFGASSWFPTGRTIKKLKKVI